MTPIEKLQIDLSVRLDFLGDGIRHCGYRRYPWWRFTAKESRGYFRITPEYAFYHEHDKPRLYSRVYSFNRKTYKLRKSLIVSFSIVRKSELEEALTMLNTMAEHASNVKWGIKK